MPLACSRRLAGFFAPFSIAVALPSSLAAQGDLLIAPTRLVLDGRRGGEVILSNIRAEEATYRVTLELRRMTPECDLEPVEDAEANVSEKAALEMIRYAPRRVVLPPGEPQAFRISARPGAELPDGEYQVVARVEDANTPVAGHVQEVQCIRAPCPPQLATLSVAGGKEIANADLNGFYAERAEFPVIE